MKPAYLLRRLLPCAVLLSSMIFCAVQAQTIGTFPPIETSINLPQDEASHRQPAEWWYMTGFLDGIDPIGNKRSYGYELVVFQIAAVAGLPPVYDSHLAITDLTRGTFKFEKRVTPGPFTQTQNRIDLDVLGFKLGGSMGSYSANAAFGDLQYAIDLKTTPNVPPTMNGIGGVETYGAWKSPYYSFTSNATTGTLWDHGVPVKVTGTTWYDHEWATGAPGQADSGWTWFGVSMDDNTQYNLSFFMKGDGSIDKVIGVRTANGTFTPIPENQLSLQRIGSWTSPHTGYTYPARWAVTLPNGSITITPLVQDSELHAPVTQKFYFEGAASVSGTLDGKSATGKAFAEMNPWGVNWGTRVLP